MYRKPYRSLRSQINLNFRGATFEVGESAMIFYFSNADFQGIGVRRANIESDTDDCASGCSAGKEVGRLRFRNSRFKIQDS